MDKERFVRALAATLPEAFEGLDVEVAYFSPSDGHGWDSYVPLTRARDWIEDHALTVDRRAETVEVTRAEVLQRFFSFIESVAQGADENTQNLLMIELFEGTPWTEDVLRFLGPETVELLRRAQVELAPYNGWIGRWHEGPSGQ
jgi:hypothetical protein